MESVQEIISEIVESIKQEELVVFCGAGVSHNSGLPIVNQFIPHVLLRLIGTFDEEMGRIDEELHSIKDYVERQNRLIEILSDKIGTSKEAITKILNNLPFEAFIEIMQNNSNADPIYDIYDADKPKPDTAKPNTNHIFLAKLVKVKKLKTVVTTNFDQLIEKALVMEPAPMEEGKHYNLLYKEKDFEKINWEDDRMRLIKIHGSIHDTGNMGITIKQIAAKELSAQRNHIINQIFSSGSHKTVLMLGYSCSDVFDLIPQIQAIKEKCKRVIFVQHVGEEEKPDLIKLSHASKKENDNKRGDKVYNAFKDFEGVRLLCNTDLFIETLWKVLINDEYKLVKSETNWQDKVNGWLGQTPAYDKDNVLGQVFYSISEFQTSIFYSEKALTIAKREINKQAEGTVFGNLGNAYNNLGNYSKAIEYHGQALEISRQIGNRRGEGGHLGNLGIAYVRLGDYPKAIKYHEQALKISWQIGDRRGEGGHLGNLGIAYRRLGNYPKAIKYHEKALEISRQIGDKQGEGCEFGNLGIAYRNFGNYPKAIEYCEQALNISQQIGDKRNEGNQLGNLGNAYNNLGNYSKAIEYHEQALKVARVIGDKRNEGNQLGNLGNTYNNFGNYPKAIEYCEQALKISRQIGDKCSEGIQLGNLGRAYNGLGDAPKAIEHYKQALEIFRPMLGDNHLYTKIVKENLRKAEA